MSDRFAGRYAIERELGRGSFGVVYFATDLELDRPVALKILHAALAVEPATVQLFKREAAILARLDHDNIIPVYDVGVSGDARYIVMKYVEGTSLAQVMAREGAQPVAQVMTCLEQIAAGLDYAHSRGVLHRDLKPGNLLLDAERNRVLLTDFGLAHAVQNSGGSSSQQSQQKTSGTVGYLAPEVLQGEPATAASDRYSLGCVLYELLAGRPPFRGDKDMAIMYQHVHASPPALVLEGAVGEALAAQVMALLAKAPEARPASASAVVQAVIAARKTEEAAAAQKPQHDRAATSSWQPAAVLPPPRQPSRWGWWAALAGVVAAAALAVALIPQWLAGPAAATPDATAQALAVENAVLNTRMALAGDSAVTAALLPGSRDAAPTAAIDPDLAAAVAATLTAQAPTATASATPTPTPDAAATATAYAALLQAALDATRTALPPTATAETVDAPTPDATATEQALLAQVADAVAATITAQAPTATHTPTVTPTPDAPATAAAIATALQARAAATLTAAVVTPTRMPTMTPTPRPPTAPEQTATAVVATAEFVRSLPTWTPTFTVTPTYTPTPTATPNATATAAMALVQALPTLQARGVDPALRWKAHPLDGAIYLFVLPGEFIMGSDRSVDTLASVDEQPQRTVKLNGYWIMQTEVTNAQYARCVAAGACTPPANDRWEDAAYAEHPVVDVDWNQAVAYATWVGGRLPTEAEWERACRGMDGRVYPWGDAAPDGTLLNFANVMRYTQPVASYAAGRSPANLFDMAGNVREWTADWYDGNYYTWARTDNPAGPAKGTVRALRGGSWFTNGGGVRCAYRSSRYTDYRGGDVGFRVVSPGF